METLMRSLLLPALLAMSLAAQDKPAPVRLAPLRVSPASTVTQEIGISRIELSFSRPAVKGRKIWGGLVPFGEVWRTGANNATAITFSHAAKVAGKDVPAGSYGLFAIPGEKTWTLILNKKAKQWGAYDYKKEEDQLRWEVTPQAGVFLEYLEYRVLPVDPGRSQQPEPFGKFFGLGRLEFPEFSHQGPKLGDQGLLGLDPVPGGQFLEVPTQCFEGRRIRLCPPEPGPDRDGRQEAGEHGKGNEQAHASIIARQTRQAVSNSPCGPRLRSRATGRPPRPWARARPRRPIRRPGGRRH